MSIYDPPNEIPLPPIFNPINFVSENGMGISQGVADLRYLKKSGDTATGVINFSSGILTNDGSNLTTPFGFLSQSGTGMYRIGASNLGFSVAGVKELDITTSLLTSANPISLPSGSVSSNAVQIGSVNTGIYSSAANTLNLSTNGTNRVNVDTSTVTCTLPVQVPSTASASTCGIQVGLANTGIYYNAGVLYFVLGGTIMSRFQAAQIYSSQPHNFSNGGPAAPSICASSFQTTGLSWATGPILNVSVSGVRRAFFNTTGVAIGDLGDSVARKNFGSYTFTAPNLSQHGTANTTITFTNAFASTPRVYLSTQFNSASSTYMYGVASSVSDIGTTSFKINICNLVNNVTTGDIVVNWIAEL